MTVASSRADIVLSGATIAFLFAAPFTGSAGLRATLLIVAIFALVLLHSTRPGLDALPRTILVAFGAWAFIAVASTGWSIQPGYSLGELRPEILYGAMTLGVFLLAARDASRWPRWRAALLLGTLAVVVVHLAQALLPFALTRHGTDGGLWSTHLVLIAPLLLTLAWPAPWGGGANPALQAAALLLLFGAAWETGNRAVWMALGAQFAIAIALSRGASPADQARLRAFRGLALAAALLAVVALFVSIQDRITFASPGATMAAGLASDVRPRIWSVAWSRFLEAPWLGHGFGREILAAEFMKLTPPTLAHPPIQHSHNLFIDLALQLGTVGLAAFAALLVVLGVEYRAYLRDPRVAQIGIVGLALLAGFVLKNLTDDFLHRHNGLVFWALNGMLLGFARARVHAIESSEAA